MDETRSGPAGIGIGIDNVDALLLDRWEGSPFLALSQDGDILKGPWHIEATRHHNNDVWLAGDNLLPL
jgi:hypothetical protein